MIQREEALIREGSFTQEYAKKVDESLRSETSAFFSRVAQQNVKKFNTFAAKVNRERDILKHELVESLNINMAQDNTNAMKNKQYSVSFMTDLDNEAQRLDEIYNEKWYEFESFNLEEAFRSQYARIETEWNSHLQSLRDNIQSKKRQLNRTDMMDIPGNNNAMSSPSSADSRWQHPEKQKTLIHTAPVLSPTSNNKDRAVGSALKAVRTRGKDDGHAKLLAEVIFYILNFRCIMRWHIYTI